MSSPKSSPIIEGIRSSIAASGEALLKTLFSKKLKLLSEADPSHVFVENISAFFNVSHSTAKLACEIAVRQGQFRKRVGFRCPVHNNLLLEADVGEPLPEQIDCVICEATGERAHLYQVKALTKMEFYAVR